MRRRPAACVASLFSAVIGLSSSSGSDRVPEATLSGFVLDVDGAPLAGVTIEVDSPALIGRERQTTSNIDGRFRFPALPPGKYNLAARLFAYFRQTDNPIELFGSTATTVVLLRKNPEERIGIELSPHERVTPAWGRPSTLDMAEEADFVGVWGSGNIESFAGAQRLGRPGTRIRGDLALVERTTTYTRRLLSALRRIACGQSQILFLSTREATGGDPAPPALNLASDDGAIPFHRDFTMKAVEDTIAVAELLRAWISLDPHERWRRSDLVFVGSFVGDGRLPIYPDVEVCKGALPEGAEKQSLSFKHMAKPGGEISAEHLARPGLWFLASNPGTGQAFVVLGREEVGDTLVCPSPPLPPKAGPTCP